MDVVLLITAFECIVHRALFQQLELGKVVEPAHVKVRGRRILMKVTATIDHENWIQLLFCESDDQMGKGALYKERAEEAAAAGGNGYCLYCGPASGWKPA